MVLTVIIFRLILCLMFKNKTLIIAVLVIVLLLGAGAYLKLSKSTTVAPQPSATQGQPKTAESITKGTIKSLFGLGKSSACTINFPNNQGQGTIYLANKMLRGDFTMTGANGKTFLTHVIQSGDYMYLWTTETPQGMKFKIDLTKNANSTDGKSDQIFDYNKEVNYKCSDWGADNSKFTPPTDIKFLDMTSLTSPKAETTKTQTGSPCDQISDPTAKAACVKAVSGGN